MTGLNRNQIELIHREIDGANTADESAAFRSLIVENAEARALEADLRHVTLLFDRVGEREPPAHLRQAILDALPVQPRASSSWEALGNAVKALVEGLQRRPRFALVSSVCVGLVAGFGLYAALAGNVLSDHSSTSGLAGTLFESGAADAVETVNDVAIGVPGASGHVSLKAGRTEVLVELELNAEHPMEVRLTFDRRAYGLRAFSQQRSEAGRYVAEPGVIRVSTSGRNRHTFVLHREGPVSPLVLSLFEGGEEIFAATLDSRRPNQGG